MLAEYGTSQDPANPAAKPDWFTGEDQSLAAGQFPNPLPVAPTAVVGTPSSLSAIVTWTAPKVTGGSITGYRVTPSPGVWTDRHTVSHVIINAR